MTDHQALTEFISVPREGMEVFCIGRSILGRDIPVISLGKGERAVLYVGGIRGTQSGASGLLLEFVRDYLQQYERNATVYEYAMQYLFCERRIFVLPMLDPDGIAYALHGVSPENPLAQRVERMQAGSELSAWQANARGVDLQHNFAAGFQKRKQKERSLGIVGGAPQGYGGEFPESEPETVAVGRFLRHYRDRLTGVLALHSGAGEVRCCCGDHMTAKCMAAGRVLSRMTGCDMIRPEEVLAEGGLTEWCVNALSRPAFDLCYREEGAELEYARLRRALFSFPCIV